VVTWPGVMTREQARARADAHVAGFGMPGCVPVVRDPPVARPYGWVFRWSFHATDPDSWFVDGPRLLVVERETGRLIDLDSIDSRRAWRAFERARGHSDLTEDQIDALCAITDAEIDKLFR
jgi:hypothetical protein